MAVNEQYSDPPFGLGGDYTSTGAAGTPSPGAESSAGPVVGSPAVVGVHQSSQLPIAHVTVTSGDSFGSASDSPVPGPIDPMTGVTASFITSTGAGEGSGHDPHPNSMSRPA